MLKNKLIVEKGFFYLEGFSAGRRACHFKGKHAHFEGKVVVLDALGENIAQEGTLRERGRGQTAQLVGSRVDLLPLSFAHGCWHFHHQVWRIHQQL